MIDGFSLRVGGLFGVAHAFFPDGSYHSRISYRPGNVRDGAAASVFEVEEKFVSITRSAKLYSTTRAVLRRWED